MVSLEVDRHQGEHIFTNKDFDSEFVGFSFG